MEQVNSTIIQSVVEQHAEEAAFLWLQRDAAVCAPHYSLDDLAELDDRVEAHIDGLRIAGDEGWEICKESLEWEEPGEIFTAAFLAFEKGNDAWIQTVLEAGSESLELSRGIISALGWLSYPRAEAHIQKFLISESPDLRRIGIAACALHRKDPGKALIDVLSDKNILLRARALKAAGELGRIDLLPLLRHALAAGDNPPSPPFSKGGDLGSPPLEKGDVGGFMEVMCRFRASWSSAILGNSGSVSILTSFVPSANPPHPNPLPQGARERAEEAVKIAMRKMDISSAHNWQRELAQNPGTIRLALIGAGVIGDPVLIPWLIDHMAVPELARVAGEAFTMITGIDIAYEDLEGEWPEGFEAGPTEEDEDVEMDPDEDLPWPEPRLIAEWWDKNKRNFSTGKHYLLGKPINKENLQLALKNGYQRQRAAAALEIAMIQPGQPLFEVRAPGFRQKQLLGLK